MSKLIINRKNMQKQKKKHSIEIVLKIRKIKIFFFRKFNIKNYNTKQIEKKIYYN